MYMNRSKPEKQWMLGLLGWIHPENEIFQKGYRPPSRQLIAQSDHQKQMIPNRGGFFDNLDPLNVKELKRKGSVNFLTKKEKLQFEL